MDLAEKLKDITIKQQDTRHKIILLEVEIVNSGKHADTYLLFSELERLHHKNFRLTAESQAVWLEMTKPKPLWKRLLRK